MKFLKISDIKLKVTLSPEECVAYGIDTDKSDFTGSEIRRTVRTLLADAEYECGFCTEGDKILVQICPLPDGNCEILISRLVGVSRRERAALSHAEGVSLIERRNSVYRFSSALDLKRGITALYRDGVDSDLYRDDLGRYYILVREELKDGVSELEPLVEFADRLPSFPLAVISEYGVLITECNAFDYVFTHDIDDFDNYN